MWACVGGVEGGVVGNEVAKVEVRETSGVCMDDEEEEEEADDDDNDDDGGMPSSSSSSSPTLVLGVGCAAAASRYARCVFFALLVHSDACFSSRRERSTDTLPLPGARKASRVRSTGLPFLPRPSPVGLPGAPSGSLSLTLFGIDRLQFRQVSVDDVEPAPAPPYRAAAPLLPRLAE